MITVGRIRMRRRRKTRVITPYENGTLEIRTLMLQPIHSKLKMAVLLALSGRGRISWTRSESRTIQGGCAREGKGLIPGKTAISSSKDHICIS